MNENSSETILKELNEVFNTPSALTSEGLIFLEKLVVNNEKLFLETYSIFNITRREEVYRLLLSQGQGLLNLMNTAGFFRDIILKRVLIYLLRKGLHDTTTIKVTRLEKSVVGLEKDYRLLFIGDLQLGQLVQNPDNIKQKIMELDVDILVLGGDIIDTALDIVNLEAYLGDLGIEHKYYVNGNHEHNLSKSNFDKLSMTLKTLGFENLNNKNTTLKGLNIIGIDDIYSNKDCVVSAYSGLTGQCFNLVVTHNHDINYILDEGRYAADLILSGHTHGGQILIPFKRAVRKTKLWKEYNCFRGSYVYKGKNRKYNNYTVNGLGGSRTPLRINAQQEMLLLNIKKQ